MRVENMFNRFKLLVKYFLIFNNCTNILQLQRFHNCITLCRNIYVFRILFQYL